MKVLTFILLHVATFAYNKCETILSIRIYSQTWSQGHNMQGRGHIQGLDLLGQEHDSPKANVSYRKNYKSDKMELV